MNSPESDVDPPVDATDDQHLHPADQPSPSPQPATETVPVCDADAFMDEEDSEAVAERLRQLGYI